MPKERIELKAQTRNEEINTDTDKSIGIKGITTTLDHIEPGTEETYKEELKYTKRRKRDLPEGVSSRALYRDILRIAWPSLAELLLGSLVNMVDMMMVEASAPEAISAVGLAMQPRLLQDHDYGPQYGRHGRYSQSLAALMTVRGQQHPAPVTGIGNLISIVCAVFGTIGSKWMITFMAAGGMRNRKQLIWAAAIFCNPERYLHNSGLSFCISAALRGTGNTKPCMIYNIVANLVNIVGNWLLINGNLGFLALGGREPPSLPYSARRLDCYSLYIHTQRKVLPQVEDWVREHIQV